VAFRHHAEGPDCGKHPAFLAVDFIHTIAVSHWPTLTATGQVEVLCEHITRVPIPIAITHTAAATEVAVPTIAPISPAIPRIVPVPHVLILPLSADHIPGIALSGLP